MLGLKHLRLKCYPSLKLGREKQWVFVLRGFHHLTKHMATSNLSIYQQLFDESLQHHAELNKDATHDLLSVQEPWSVYPAETLP